MLRKRCAERPDLNRRILRSRRRPRLMRVLRPIVLSEPLLVEAAQP